MKEKFNKLHFAVQGLILSFGVLFLIALLIIIFTDVPKILFSKNNDAQIKHEVNIKEYEEIFTPDEDAFELNEGSKLGVISEKEILTGVLLADDDNNEDIVKTIDSIKNNADVLITSISSIRETLTNSDFNGRNSLERELTPKITEAKYFIEDIKSESRRADITEVTSNLAKSCDSILDILDSFKSESEDEAILSDEAIISMIEQLEPTVQFQLDEIAKLYEKYGEKE